MPENYARENTNCKNNAANKKSGSACNAKTPMSKQNAAQRKTQDCEK